MATDTKLVASAGEHHVCSMLARHGWAASLTRDGLERSDILAVQTSDRRMIEVQVKTIASGTSWPLGAKGTVSEAAGTDHEWYVLVRLGDIANRPETFVVPRNHVAAATWIGHMNWRTHPDAPPGKRNAGISAARIGVEVWRGYQDRWNDLGSPTPDAQVRLPIWMRTVMREERVLLPDGHPWHDDAVVPPWIAGADDVEAAS